MLNPRAAIDLSTNLSTVTRSQYRPLKNQGAFRSAGRAYFNPPPHARPKYFFFLKGSFYRLLKYVRDKEMKMVRPNPKPGEALIFSPFLIHGAAINGNKDLTRISLELRFPKAIN